MSIVTSPAADRPRWERNFLALCACWFLYMMALVPVSIAWSKVGFAEHPPWFSGTLGLFLIISVPCYLVAVLCGALLFRHIASRRPRFWAAGFGAYLALLSYLSGHWPKPPVAADLAASLLADILVGVAAFAGFVAATAWATSSLSGQAGGA